MYDREQLYLLVCLLFVIINKVSAAGSNAGQAFTSYGLTPDIITVPPYTKSEIYYPHSNQAVNLGTEISPSKVQQPPEVYFQPDNPDSYYTLVTIDPDAPSRSFPILREWLHWLVVNIPGTNVVNGQVLADYAGPHPPRGGGIHRYVFLIYKQPRRLVFHGEPYRSSTDRGGRPRFSVEEFSEKYGLGNAVAGNFFLAQYDGVEGPMGSNASVVTSVYFFSAPRLD